MPNPKKVARAPKGLPTAVIAGETYALVPASLLAKFARTRNCKFIQRGPSYDEWKDAMDRFYGCLFGK